MPRPALRTRTKRRRTVPLPGGRRPEHFKRKKVKVARCAFCGRPLAIPRISAGSSGKLPKTAKRPERIYGGQICPICLKELIRRSVKGLS